MKHELFLGIDQGSSSTKGVLIDQNGETVAEFTAAVPEIVRQEVCVEQDPKGLLDSVLDIFDRGQAVAKSDGRPLRAWGLATQRSGVLAWRAKSQEILHPLITWADTRSQPIITGFGRGVEGISVETGLPTIANFAAPKIHLLQRQFEEPSALVATLDSYILHLLSDGAVFSTEDSMAARTMLYSLRDRTWSDRLCRQFKVDKQRLPSIAPSIATSSMAHLIHQGIPLLALLGDQQAALLGRISLAPKPLLNLGTIASLSIFTGDQILWKPAMKTSVFYSRRATVSAAREFAFMTELTSSVTGSILLEPLRRAWCADTQELNDMCQRAYHAEPAGLATAYWTDRDITNENWPKGVPNVTVCKPGAAVADRARAIVENVGNLIVRMIEECAEKNLLGDRFPAQIDIAGGGSEVEYLLQYVADVSGHTLAKLAAREAGSRGAALAAWMSVYPERDLGVFNKSDPARLYQCCNPERRRRYLIWQKMESDALNNRLPAHAEME